MIWWVVVGIFSASNEPEVHDVAVPLCLRAEESCMSVERRIRNTGKRWGIVRHGESGRGVERAI